MSDVVNEPKEENRPRGSAEPVEGRCGRKLRNSDPPRYCNRYPLEGRTACKLHGGASPVGIASKSYKTGRHSDYMPKPLMDRHEDRLARLEEVRRLDEEIVGIDGRISDLWQCLVTGERGSVWDDMQGAVGEFAEAYEGWEESTGEEREAALQVLRSKVQSLRAIADAGKANEQAWRELYDAWQLKAKLVTAEGKRMADMGETASRDEVKTMVISIVNIVKDHVQDQATLTAISKDLVHVIGRQQ